MSTRKLIKIGVIVLVIWLAYRFFWNSYVAARVTQAPAHSLG